jgi:hypothetical protein
MGSFLSSLFPRFTPSPPFAPFSRLPTELLEQIIGSTVPSSYDSRTFRQRQSTLLSFCLVSRLFYQIFQPLLCAVVRIQGRPIPTWLLIEAEEAQKAAKAHELLIVNTRRTFRISFDELQPNFLVQTRLTQLVLSRLPNVDFSEVSLLPRKHFIPIRRSRR